MLEYALKQERSAQNTHLTDTHAVSFSKSYFIYSSMNLTTKSYFTPELKDNETKMNPVLIATIFSLQLKLYLLSLLLY